MRKVAFVIVAVSPAALLFVVLGAVEKKAYGANCTHLPDSCQTWDTNNPLVEGKCCVDATGNTVKGCTSPSQVKSVTKLTTQCAKLVDIVSGECSETQTGTCGGMKAKTNCVSGDCPKEE